MLVCEEREIIQVLSSKERDFPDAKTYAGPESRDAANFVNQESVAITTSNASNTWLGPDNGLTCEFCHI